MDLAEEYRRQKPWRSWSAILDALPPLDDKTVLDLGCGIGDVAAELVARGARVIGYDLNEELLAAAQARGLPRARFIRHDIRDLPRTRTLADGIWCSFAAAYFPDLTPVLEAWAETLQPSGWIALTEIDDLFGHEPLDARSKKLFDAYAQEAHSLGRYDFLMGQKLAGHLERAGYRVVSRGTVPDCELAFEGPALAEVIDGWRRRFERMSLLRELGGDDFERTRNSFLAALASEDHHSLAKVVYCIATRRAFVASGSFGATRTAS